MPIPYMGSKAKSATHIFNVINAFTKDRKENLLVELFTGGFAIGEIFIEKGWKTIQSDKNKYVMALLEKSLDGLPDEVYDWVSRDKFENVLKNPNKYEDWYVGFIQCVWSFGNNQKGYLYGRDIEELKKQADDLVVRKEVGEMMTKLIPKKYIDGILKQDTVGKRRMAMSKVAEKLGNLGPKGMQRLQNLERLQRLQRLQLKQNILHIHKGKSYEEIEIPTNAVVYCDPPYKGTATYAEGGFNHNKFWEYIRQLSKTNKVFISEYTAPDDFRVIYEFSQKSCLAGGTQTHNNQPNEKLFVYKG